MPDIDIGTARGDVKWFSESKGYGFLRLEDGREVFFHFSKIAQDRKVLADGEPVTCGLRKGDKGIYAYDIRTVNP